MAEFDDAVMDYEDGILISLDVSAGSKKTIFPAGYNCWRSAVSCKIKAPPVEGKANKMIISAVASYFSVHNNDVSIISGTTSSSKRVYVKGISKKNAVEILLKSL
ncbi:YggU family protein [Methanoplanus sp. FWC-SCC4]|uniref:UPF0235 protein F1737_04440 n=1 Tax=Methanochimaera problematica TaxID=2609417 RepID=A0AA97I403_9EURY|nr:DUF167 family protein [Methanoplanus sp. FWC-SCC4]WOF16004.1 YggU family protein [Methanoplanus sp. FWC-SCC4]